MNSTPVQTITLSSLVAIAPGQVSTNLDGEIVILDAKSGQYYGLGEVGARVWELIQEPKLVVDIRAAILAEYDVEAKQCEEDLLALLRDLLANGLVESKSGNEVS